MGTTGESSNRTYDGAHSHGGPLFNQSCFYGPVNFSHGATRSLYRDVQDIEAPGFTDEEKDCLQSLSFEKLESRQNVISEPHADTFTWVFERPEYKDWYERRAIGEHKGVLFIKGKPGSGKSVIMKKIFLQLQHAQPERCTIGFFFNRRGTPLEKQPLGLFRSLLHQLMRQQRDVLTSFLPKFRMKRDTLKKGWEWQEEELRDHFSAIVRTCQQFAMAVFIDALDECEPEDDMRLLVHFFAKLSSHSTSNGNNFIVCLSSRDHPHVSISECPELFVDLWNETDIMKYVESEFPIEDAAGNTFQREITEKASGIFLWVILVVKSLAKERDAGRTVKEMRSILENVPKELDELFTRYFNSVSSRDRSETMRLMQWVLFAQRSLTAAEISCALAFGGCSPPQSYKAWQNESDDNEERIKKRLRSLSKGLIEIKRDKSETRFWWRRLSYDSTERYVVQFIHESVREFLVRGGGLCMLDPSIGQLVPAKTHDLLARTCFNFLGIEELRGASSGHAGVPKDNLSSERTQAENVKEKYGKYVLWEYAVTSAFEHAFKAESNGVNQRWLASRYCTEYRKEFDDWRFFSDSLRKLEFQRARGPTTSFFHFASERGLLSCVEELLAQGVDPNITGGNFQYALIAAASEGSTSIVKVLLQHGAGKAVEDERGRTALHWAVENGHDEMLRLLLKEGLDAKQKDKMGKTVLHVAAESTFRKDVMAQLLIEELVGVDEIDNERRTALHYAAKSAHTEQVALLLENGANLKLKDEKDKTALHFAAGKGSLEVVNRLIEYGADALAQDDEGWQPIHSAAENGHLDIVDRLVGFGVGALAQDNSGWQLIHSATKNGYLDVVDQLIGLGADASAEDNDGWQPIHSAAENGYLDIVDRLLGLDVDASAEDDSGWQPIHSAAENGYLDIVDRLVGHRAKASAKDDSGWQPIHSAARSGHLDVVNQLIGLGVEPSVQDYDGWEPIHSAAEKGHLDVVSRLVGLGVRASVQDNEGWQPIHSAAHNGHLQVVDLLVRSGANVSAQKKDGLQPVHSAALNGHLEIVSYLVEHGADAKAQKKDGLQPIHSAAQNGHLEVIDELIRHGADTKAQDNDGWQPIHSAAFKGSLKAVSRLAELGADITAQNKKGLQPIHLAAQKGHFEVVNRLIELQAGALTQKRNELQSTQLGVLESSEEQTDPEKTVSIQLTCRRP